MKTVRVQDVRHAAQGVFAVEAALPLSEAVARMRTHRIHHLVVLRKGHVAGILSHRDIIDHGLLPNDFAVDPILAVGAVMHASTAAVNEDTTVREALAMMARDRCDALPVVQSGKLVGLLTESDILRVLSESLEADAPTGEALGAASVALGNPMLQSAMMLLSEAGI